MPSVSYATLPLTNERLWPLTQQKWNASNSSLCNTRMGILIRSCSLWVRTKRLLKSQKPALLMLVCLTSLFAFAQNDTGELRLEIQDAGGLPIQCSVEIVSLG